MFRLPKASTCSSGIRTPAPVSLKNHGLCKFPYRKCSFVCLENFNYCLKHILEDKTAPYKPCPYLYTVSGKKCGKPAYRPERKDTWFCAEHSRKAHLQRQRALRRHAPPDTQETLFASLAHYVPPEKSAVKKEEGENEDSTSIENLQALNPFVDINASVVNNACVNQLLDFASDSDSDVDPAMLDSVWRAQDHESSDAESIDSQNDDPLKHAGTYTAEEVMVIIKEKMLRLQSLYIDQFRRLHDILKERRRKYLLTLKKEKESLCSIHDQEKTTAREQKLYQKLKALNRYHKHYGVEAILHKKALEKRAQATDGHLVRTSHKGKCAFTEGGVKCGAKTLPVTKYCRKHILEDTHQVLFRACGFKRDDHVCQEPTLNVFENASCVYHMTLPALPHEKSKMNEDNKIETTENDFENSLINVDTEDLLLKNIILKPSTTKSAPVDALELSRSVSALLSLAEDHPDQTLSEQQTSDKTPSTEDKGVSESENVAVKNESHSEKMDVDLDEKACPQSTEEFAKQGNPQDLVMVDMMTDVGVVEEVLEAEQVGSEQELVVSEQEVEVSEQEVEVSQQEVEVSQQEVEVSEQEVEVSEQEVLGSEQQVVVSDQVIASEQEVAKGQSENMEVDSENAINSENG